VAGWFEGAAARAFVVHRPAVLKGMRTRAIVDAGSVPGAERELHALIRAVCARSRGDAGLAASMISRSHPAYPSLRTAGFFRGPHRFQLLVQVFDPRYRGVMSAPWALSWGDTDHL
jgi:hypothetical protein